MSHLLKQRFGSIREIISRSLLHILATVDRIAKSKVLEGGGKMKNVKDEKNAKRKAKAAKEFNWSMLYMNVYFISKITFLRCV